MKSVLERGIQRSRTALSKPEVIQPFAIWLASRIFFYGSTWIIARILEIDLSRRTFRQWDANWYLTIIRNGYMHEVLPSGPDVGQANWAFFPVMPLLVRLLSALTINRPLLMGYVVSNLALLVALIYLYKYLVLEFSPRVARVTVIFMAFSPVNVYFTSLYTESLFLALLMAMIFYTRQHNWILAGICGAFLSGTRNTGIFMILIFIFEFLRTRDSRITFKQKRDFYIGLLIFPLGLILFMAHLAVVAGDPLAFYHVQAAWNGPDQSHLEFFGEVFKHPSRFQIFTDLSLVAAFFSAIYLLKKQRVIDALVILPISLISLISMRVQYRFYFALYPIYLVVAGFLHDRKFLLRMCYVIEGVVLCFAIKFWITGIGPT